jgi:hypothetical protein
MMFFEKNSIIKFGMLLLEVLKNFISIAEKDNNK